jgi:amino acid transporter
MPPEPRETSEHGLRRQLSLGDLVFSQVLAVVGSAWVGIAAALGHTQTVVWLLAMASFYLPMAVAVYYLNRAMPLEGGLYTWARRGFGDVIGFLVAWNVWTYALLDIATIFSQLPSEFAFMVGPRMAWLPENHIAVLTSLMLIVVAMAVAALLGLGLGKWIHNLSSAAMILAFALLIAAPVWVKLHHVPLVYHPVEFHLPAASAKNLALIAQTLIASSGLEYLAILAGETHHPQRNISRSVVLASPIIIAMFVLGTSSVLAFHEYTGAAINFVAPIPQTLMLAFGDHGVGSLLSRLAILLLQIRILGAANFMFAGVTRLPMTAGWDHLVPSWFARLHPRFRTPSNAILVGALAVAGLLLLSYAGSHASEAFALLNNASNACYALAYVAMFLIPIAGAVAIRSQMPRWVKWFMIPGVLAMVFSVCLEAYPFLDVPNPMSFAIKIVLTTLALNALGFAFYRIRNTKRIATL